MRGGHRSGIAVHIGTVFSAYRHFQYLTRIAALQSVARYDAALADRFTTAVVHHACGRAFNAPLVFRRIGWITGVGCKGVAAAQRFAHRQFAADGHGADAWFCGFIHDGATVSTALGIVAAAVLRGGHRSGIAVHIGTVFSTYRHLQHLTRVAALQGVIRYDATLVDRFAATIVHHACGRAFHAPLVFRRIGWVTGVGCKGVATAQGFAHRQLAADGHGADTWCHLFIYDGAAVATALGVVAAAVLRSGHRGGIAIHIGAVFSTH